MSLNFGHYPLQTTELVAIERLKHQCTLYNAVTTKVPSFLIRSSSFLQVMRTKMKAGISSNFRQIQPRTADLAALERLKNPHRLSNGRNV